MSRVCSSIQNNSRDWTFYVDESSFRTDFGIIVEICCSVIKVYLIIVSFKKRASNGREDEILPKTNRIT